MRTSAAIAGIVSALVLAGAAGHASAQTATQTQPARSRAPAVSLSEAASAQRAQPQRRGLRLNENGRWGLNFNLNQPVGREAEWGDVEAGVAYNLSPRLSVGAAAGLGRAEQDPARAPETDRRAQPRVRLESIFKF